MTLVADTSALVSVAATDEARRTALPRLLDGYDLVVPSRVVAELEEVASHDDEHARAARFVLDERDRFDVDAADLDTELPLDDGENAAIQLSNRVDAAFFYCDEYTELALVHAALEDARLVTTPKLLHAFVVNGAIRHDDARALLEGIAANRSWEENAYVQQARTLFE